MENDKENKELAEGDVLDIKAATAPSSNSSSNNTAVPGQQSISASSDSDNIEDLKEKNGKLEFSIKIKKPHGQKKAGKHEKTTHPNDQEEQQDAWENGGLESDESPAEAEQSTPQQPTTDKNNKDDAWKSGGLESDESPAAPPTPNANTTPQTNTDRSDKKTAAHEQNAAEQLKQMPDGSAQPAPEATDNDAELLEQGKKAQDEREALEKELEKLKKPGRQTPLEKELERLKKKKRDKKNRQKRRQEQAGDQTDEPEPADDLGDDFTQQEKDWFKQEQKPQNQKKGKKPKKKRRRKPKPGGTQSGQPQQGAPQSGQTDQAQQQPDQNEQNQQDQQNQQAQEQQALNEQQKAAQLDSEKQQQAQAMKNQTDEQNDKNLQKTRAGRKLKRVNDQIKEINTKIDRLKKLRQALTITKWGLNTITAILLVVPMLIAIVAGIIKFFISASISIQEMTKRFLKMEQARLSKKVASRMLSQSWTDR